MTDFLYARPSFIDGLMSLVDLFGISPEYNTSANAAEADRRAFAADADSLRSDFDIIFS